MGRGMEEKYKEVNMGKTLTAFLKTTIIEDS